ncbi:MAG: metallophosphoesterase [Candidatus Latescibacteria bacterium]|nr:metallophosphoesterase [Candidatus Latescibacterota bacterium]NIO29051.1 metallophosphoesterase [Candidatus Latescibacterota bacterium]NIO56676.1 metallophosphoesterase [Candidatus Latescibacterota bacterium]NIT02259.1 metallophosphoesterase [Candidatus Latescibacterota bacterium]NIT39144.1 metallophosphoesterase [Candidatus Latescibacterota bacterium]
MQQAKIHPQGDKIRIVFFADTHLGFDYPLRPKVARRRRGGDFYDNYKAVLGHAIDTRADLVIHGGDFFFRSRVPKKIIDLAYGPLFEFAAHGIPFLIVPGNHERSELPTSLYLAHPNIYVFNRPRTYTFDIAGAKIGIAGFPFERGDIRSRFGSVLAQTGWDREQSDVNLLCIHQAVEGAQVGPSNYTFRHGEDVVKIDDPPAEFMAVLAGHIHRKQIFTRRAGRNRGEVTVIYPGSTERTSFAEKMEEKGFFEITLTRIDGSQWRMGKLDFKTLPARPMVDLLLDASVSRSNLRFYIASRVGGFEKDAIVRIRSKGKLDDGIRSTLTTEFLRGIFPDTMNFQFSSGFFQRRSGR